MRPSHRQLKISLCVSLALIALPAFAVDPSLHNLPETHYFADEPLPPLDPAATAGLEVQEIKDLGAKPYPTPEPEQAVELTEPPDDLWERIRNGFAMANLDGPLVVERQAWYAERPQQMKIMVDRSRRYLFHIVEELERRSMPTELALLPMVESAFNPMAYSHAKASGLWQFIPSTGKSYKLEQNWWYDGRRDIVASTNAALDYLQKLYDMFGDWHLALAAYNWGEGAVSRAIERNRARGLPTDYASLDMPGETRNYVPKFQALKNIVLAPRASNVELDPIPNAPYFVTVTLTRNTDLRIAARLAEMPIEEMIKLNPAHNRPVVATAVAPDLVLPADRAEVFARNLARNDQPLSNWQTYVLRAGDKLQKLAAQYGITVARLKAINGYTAKAAIAAGTQLLVPLKGTNAAPLPGQFQPPARADGPAAVTYTVKRGDTIASIARTLRVAIAEVRRAAGASLTVGERLTLRGAPSRPQAARASKAHAKQAKAVKAPQPLPQFARRSSSE